MPAMVILLKGGTVPGQKAAADALGQFQKSTNDMPANRGDPAVCRPLSCGLAPDAFL